MKSYFPEAIKQRMKSYLTPNTISVLSKERIKSSVKMQCERRKRKTEDSELHSKTEQVRWLEKGGLGQGMLWEEFRLFGTKWISFHSNWSLLYPNIPFSLPKLRACLLQRQKYCDLGCDTARASRQAGSWVCVPPQQPRRPHAQPQAAALRKAREKSWEYRLWLALPGTRLPPLRVTAADAGSICHELIPLSLRCFGERNGSAFPTY